ncbi:MAG TPA: flavodoxin family protein [Dehalococcoidia bacterium]|nr:flavodoxin family protein [Dehalococcoidia bacterium]
MKALVVYDSQFGNTETVARAIGEALGADVIKAEAAGPDVLRGLDLLVVGAPTQAGRPTRAVKQLIAKLPPNALEGVDVAAFDTRIDASCAGFVGRIALKFLGFAAPRIERALRGKGGHAIATEGFFVEDTKGPLRAAELERAGAWARTLPRRVA